MIDIHHHLLFGLDDGARDIDTSLSMIDAAAADGITHIVCTPHSNHRYQFDPQVNEERATILRERSNGKITLGLGCDFHLSYDNIVDAVKHPRKYTINQHQYLLVEFADLMIPASIHETFYELMVVGMVPIITHPERNAVLQKNPERLKEWLQAGCLVQVTANSLTGRFGKTAQALSFSFLEKGWVHFIATDAHNVDSRPPRMREAYDIITKRYGRDTADRLCVSNPRAAFHGEALPLQPEALDLHQDLHETVKRKSGLLSWLFSR